MAVPRCRQVFGRDTEQALLRGALAKTRERRGGFVLLTGPAGMGKSRLASELLDHAERAGLATALGRATPSESSVPYRPLTQALLQSVRAVGMPDDVEFAPWRVALAPVLAGAGTEVGLAQSVAVRGEAVAQLIARTMPDGGLLVIEDLHWADPDTVALLDYLADGLASLPVLWLATARESAAATELADRLRGRRGATALTLGPLAPDAVAQMVADCRPDADGELLERVHRVGDGVPLFVEEIAAARGVPDSFGRAVVAQLDSLDAAARNVVEAAAVLGDAGTHVLAEVTGCDAETLTAHLQRAVDAGLLVHRPGAPRFRHALTREAVLDAMGERRREVAAAALALIAAESDADELAAELAAQAGDRQRAGLLLAAAGARAVAQGALPTAIETIGRAVGLLAGHPERDLVRLRLVEALGLAGRIDDAFAEAAVALAAHPSPAGQLVLAEVAARGARWTLAAQHLTTAEPGSRRDLLAAEAAFAAGRSDDARTAAQLAVDAADPDLRCRALVLLGRIDRLTDLGAARTGFERALGVARAARLPVRERDALHELGTIDLLDHAGTGKLLDARRIAERLGALGTRAVLDLQLAAAYLGRFDTAAALRHGGAAVDIADRLGLAAVSGKARCGLAEARATPRCGRHGADARRSPRRGPAGAVPPGDGLGPVPGPARPLPGERRRGPRLLRAGRRAACAGAEPGAGRVPRAMATVARRGRRPPRTGRTGRRHRLGPDQHVRQPRIAHLRSGHPRRRRR